MQQRIEEHPDYTLMLNNLIELLKAIQILMHDLVCAHYPFASMTSTLTRLLNVKQTPMENLVDYLKRYKQLKDNSKKLFGKEFLVFRT